MPEFEARGVGLIGISVDAPELTREHVKKMGFTFTFLSDPNTETTRRYDLVHAGAYEGKDIARPAEFLVDEAGVIRWTNITPDYRVRLSPDEALAALDALDRQPS